MSSVKNVFLFQNDHYNFCGIEPTNGPTLLSIRLNNIISENLSDPHNTREKKSLMTTSECSQECFSRLDENNSNNKTFQLEVIISFAAGSEYHQIIETFDHPVSSAHEYLDVIKRIKPDLNLSMLHQIVPTEKFIDSIIHYHDSK